VSSELCPGIKGKAEAVAQGGKRLQVTSVLGSDGSSMGGRWFPGGRLDKVGDWFESDGTARQGRQAAD